MKKLIAILMILMMTCASAETTQEVNMTEGLVIEVMEDGFAMATEEGILFINVTEQTVMDVEAELDVGDDVTVSYHGATDRKMITADAVCCHVLKGVVEEWGSNEEGYYLLLKPVDGSERVQVHVEENMLIAVATGMEVTVYYDGIMTRSIPAQITAQSIRGVILEGEVVQADEREVLLKLDNGEEAILHRTENTLVVANLEAGERVRASVGATMLLSLPAQYTAVDILSIQK